MCTDDGSESLEAPVGRFMGRPTGGRKRATGENATSHVVLRSLDLTTTLNLSLSPTAGCR